jgi:hypothetical protein
MIILPSRKYGERRVWDNNERSGFVAALETKFMSDMWGTRRAHEAKHLA